MCHYCGQTRFRCDEALTALLFEASRAGLAGPAHETGVCSAASVHRGLIASGDRFVSGRVESQALSAALMGCGHEVLAVEMEGAAVAQVCFDYGVPFAAARTISDRADDQAHVDFPVFVKNVASLYAQAMVHHLLRLLQKQ